MRKIGTVAELNRYPVKSMLGEALATVDVGTEGLAGDRTCALIDTATGNVVTAKLPHRWRRMLEFSARCADPAGRDISITTPDGAVLTAGGETTNAALSSALGRDVVVAFLRPPGIEMERADPDEVAAAGAANAVRADKLPLGMAAPDGGFFDYAPVHVITTASLDRVAAQSLAGVAEPARFRANIVIDTGDEPPFVENDWVGGILAIGANLRLRVILPTPRCAVPTLGHGALKADPRLTLEIGKLNKVPVLDMGLLACLGAYAQVVSSGKISVGDQISWIDANE